MAFLIFLLAYLVRRRLDAGSQQHRGDSLWRAWFHLGARTSPAREARVWPGLLMVLVPAILLVGGQYLLRDSYWRALGYPLEFLVLVFLMGAPGWRPRLKAYVDAWSRGDMQAAWNHVKDAIPAEEQGEEWGEEQRAASSPDEMHMTLSRKLITTIFERFFLVAFWYVVGGIGVALLARGLVALREQWPQAAARNRFATLVEIAGWIPARILSFTFGVAGDLAGWLRGGRQALAGLSMPVDRLLMAAANSALTGYALDPQRFSSLHPDEWTSFGHRSLEAIRDLLNRSMLVWVCVIALLVIAGVI